MRVLWFGKNFMQARLPAVPWNGYGRGCARSYLNHVGQSRCTYLHQILEQLQLFMFIIIRSEGKYIVKHYGTHSVVVTHLRHGSAVRAETHYYEIGWRPFSYHWTDPGESWSSVTMTLVLILTCKRRFYVVLSPFCNSHNYCSDIWLPILLRLAVLFINISRAVWKLTISKGFFN